MTGVIYKIENKVSGKVYIGQTIRCPKTRIQTHMSNLRNNQHINRHLQSSFNKHGEKSFSSEIIGVYPIDELDSIEIRLISFYKEKKTSYNIEHGGNARKIISDETREILSTTSRNMWKDEAIRKNIMKNLKRGKDNYNSRKIICLEDMKIFDSVTEAGDHYDLNMKNIYSCLLERQNYCHSKCKTKKYRFAFFEEEKDYIQIEPVHKLSKSVICLTTKEVFDSLTEASKKYGLETTNISKVCKGKQNSTGKLPDGRKLRWAYYEDYQALEI